MLVFGLIYLSMVFNKVTRKIFFDLAMVLNVAIPKAKSFRRDIKHTRYGNKFSKSDFKSSLYVIVIVVFVYMHGCEEWELHIILLVPSLCFYVSFVIFLAGRHVVWELVASWSPTVLRKGGLTSHTRSLTLAMSGRSPLPGLPTPRALSSRRCELVDIVLVFTSFGFGTEAHHDLCV